MLFRYALSPLLLLASLSPLMAQEVKGWGVQFYENSAGEIAIEASVNEIDSRARLTLHCLHEQGLVFSYTPRSFPITPGAPVAIRSGELTRSYELDLVRSRHFVPLQAMSREDTRDLVDVILGADEALFYSYVDTSGHFPIVGAREAIAILTEHCAER